MRVVITDKMEEKQRKKTVGDLGLTDEILELCKNLVSIESHAFGSFVSSQDKKWLRVSKKAREIRTTYLSLIVKNENQNWCFLPDTRVITKEGFKDIVNIQNGDSVLTHKNRFRLVSKLINREYLGEIAVIKTNYSNIDLKVTPNHLFYVADNLRKPQKDCWRKSYSKPNLVWKAAENLNRNDFIYLPRFNHVKNKSYIEVSFKNNKGFSDSGRIKIDEDFMRFIGLYLAEGHHCEGKTREGWDSGYVGVSFGLKEEDYANFIIRMLKERFKSNAIANHRESTIEICSGKRLTREFFKDFGDYAHNKIIPSWIIALPNKKLIPLVRGMFEGDGSQAKFDFSYSTASREMAFGLRLILNKLGILCSLSNRGRVRDSIIKGRVIHSRHDNYSIIISGDSARVFAKLLGLKYDGGKKTSGQFGYVGEDYFLIPIKEVKTEIYNGKVYNLEVEEDESYCTNSGIAHNCISKHLLESMMRLQECYTRFLSTNQTKDATACSNSYFDLYELFIELNDIDGGENNDVSNTSA